MNTQDLADFLRRTLTDRRLTNSEKTALSDWVAAHVQTDQDRGLARHTAFEIASTAISDPHTAKILDWLEDVLRVLVPMGEQSPAARSDVRSETGRQLVFFSPGERCLEQILHRFDTCRRTADVCVFTITDDRISRAILQAHRRGVNVRIISDNEKCHDPGSDIAKFREAGIAVKLDHARPRHRSDSGSNGHMHHKFAIFDGVRLVNGSYNWTRGAANENFENLIDTGDERLVAAFSEEFKRLWNQF
jgi:phosphatidylserine/phosphatidylglycerophosphate/cardiolipin synthase-like enzyme